MTMTLPEQAAYDAWLSRHQYRTYGSALRGAYLDGRRDLLNDHRDACAGCDWCADLRAWGDCTTCGGVTEAVGPDELSVCCGSRTLLNPGDRADHAALTREEADDRGFDQILHEDVWTPKGLNQ